MTTTTHPTQLRLPGQAAAPEGPCDLWMMYVTHHAYRRDLDRFVAAVAATPVDDRRTWRALAVRWDLFAAALHHHHSGEDAGLWPLLEARTDDAGRVVLAAMEAEHAEIDPLLAAIEAGLSTLAERGDEDTRAALVVRLVAGRERLGAHLAHEETEAISIMQQVLTEAEWRTVQEEHFKPEEVSLALIKNMIGWVCDGLPAPVRDRFLADTPGGRLLHRLTVPGYRRRDRRAFRYAGI